MEERICTNCQKHYKPRRAIDRIKFCSNICRTEFLQKTAKKYKTKICKFCNKEFKADYDYNFCSRSCAASSYNEHRYGPKKVHLSREEKRKLLLSTTPFCDLGETHKREIVMKEQLKLVENVIFKTGEEIL